MGQRENLKDLLTQYSFDDLAKSFFVLNMWLPNIASPIKSQYLYVTLESIFDKLSAENEIANYGDFKEFVERLLPAIPSFPMMEDYIPDNDWGEIRYYLNKKLYKMFYGGDLSNPYDFCYSFEVIHKGFERYYLEKLGRSPIKEFEFCLEIQDKIITGINIQTQDKGDIELGNFSLPTEVFWQAATTFLDSFDPTSEFSLDLINEYTRDLDTTAPQEIVSEEEFLNRANDGKNCFYFFLKKSGKLFPVLPRTYLAVVYDKWGNILSEQYPSIAKEVKHYELKIGMVLYHFIKQRAPEEEIFFICSAVEDDLGPHKTKFTTAFISKNKLVVIHVLPFPTSDTTQQKNLESLIPELKEAKELLAKPPVRLGLHGEGQMVQFQSSKEAESAPEPLIITVIPHFTTDYEMTFQPNELIGEVVGLDQFLGVLDEIEELGELADFFDYVESMHASSTLFPFASLLDRFGSFRDSNSILIPGADSPDLVVLDPHWGTSFRYRSLVKFWEVFPEDNFFGHPRSWFVEEKTMIEGVSTLRSKNYFGYFYYCLLGNASFFINSPVHTLRFEQGKISDFLMRSFADAMILYKDYIQGLSFAETSQNLQALFFPASLVEKDHDFAHLLHLMPPEGKLWMMDITRLKRNYFRVNLVFDDQKILEVFNDAKDRTVQIELLIGVLREINSIFNDPSFTQVESNLQPEKTKKNRYRLFSLRTQVSFPEGAGYTKPETREFKAVDKKIAELGKANEIIPGKYEGKEAKEKIDLLKEVLISYIDSEVREFDFKTSLPILIGNIDALTADHESNKAQVKNSLDQEVDYERDVNLSVDKQAFLYNHKNNSYLLEKFVQIQATGAKELSRVEHRSLLALADRLLMLYAISDFLHYGIYSATIEIESDFLVNIDYGADIGKMQMELAQEQAKINLGIIGNQNDRLPKPSDIEPYINELDAAFKKDLDFGLREMLSVHRILCLWAAYSSDSTEKTCYSAPVEEISDACVQNITGFDPAITQKILDFLTLDPAKILIVEGDPKAARDLPVWEYRKRSTRYSIRPLIKIGDAYYWGAHSVKRSETLWAKVTTANKLPADIKAPTVRGILEKWHQVDEKALQEKIVEIASRFTSMVLSNVYPHRLGIVTTDIGDVDILTFLETENVILNIESKVIDQAYCNKDLKRIAEKIFGRTKSDGSFEEGYLQDVERRAKLLDENSGEMIEKCWNIKLRTPKVVSLFVTHSAYWWTKYPPNQSDVKFIEVQLLEDFIRSLLSSLGTSTP